MGSFPPRLNDRASASLVSSCQPALCATSQSHVAQLTTRTAPHPCSRRRRARGNFLCALHELDPFAQVRLVLLDPVFEQDLETSPSMSTRRYTE
jgi:hypothetical protein